MPATLPLPPPEMRALVGPTDPAEFDNPSGAPVFGDLPAAVYESVLDLGSGCGRLARRLMQQRPVPKQYLGVDLHAGMVRWCVTNLTAANRNFRFVHHDVHNLGLNPAGAPPHEPRPLPTSDHSATLIIAWSVFTHLLEMQIPHYLRECARILRPGGVIRSTWFLFDKRYFPMMQAFQNTLYINHTDPTNAVIVDRNWLLSQLDACGLMVQESRPPEIRGFQWVLDLRPAAHGEKASLPDSDEAFFGSKPPPVGSVDAHRIGLDDDTTE